MARDDRRRMILVSVAGAAVTVLVVVSLTIGPTLIGCLANRKGWAACLRQQSVERGLLPPGVPATTPAAADVTQGPSRLETGQSALQEPVAAPTLLVRAAGQAAGWVRPSGQGAAQGATALRPLIGIAEGAVRSAGDQPPRLREIFRGAALLRPPLASAQPVGKWAGNRREIAMADARAPLMFVPPLAEARVTGRAVADTRLKPDMLRAAARLAPPLGDAQVEGRLRLAAISEADVRSTATGAARLVLPRLRQAEALGTPRSDWRLHVATSRAAGAATVPPPLVALGTALGGSEPQIAPQRIRVASRLVWPMPETATGRALTGQRHEQAAGLAMGLAQIAPVTPPATGSVSATSAPPPADRAAETPAIPQMPPPPLPPPVRTPSEAPQPPAGAPSPRVQLSQAQGTPPAPVPAERRSPSAALPETQRRIAADYDVVRGDTLWGISRRAYGAGRHFRVIFEANRAVIADPDLIFPGQRLAIPETAGR
ncbi:Nucleoid-associated protein YgaU, contains BON and LysM domains [Devosia enhydra]|uniref:Nucleoid-associated protein YgaU, contains BON and LysM domains n=1 Tax=Devosia enhydra TaxID=665118 RepID=A0A1K2HUE2_9HYPH|nr:LysM peptidoglycan-binding domain-containing protein [Devosia enhydra]SFZ81846.1 Nucleoid-associated protein YgaU, contains BON and LysM domains [Devosia enhydra]